MSSFVNSFFDRSKRASTSLPIVGCCSLKHFPLGESTAVRIPTLNAPVYHQSILLRLVFQENNLYSSLTVACTHFSNVAALLEGSIYIRCSYCYCLNGARGIIAAVVCSSSHHKQSVLCQRLTHKNNAFYGKMLSSDYFFVALNLCLKLMEGNE